MVFGTLKSIASGSALKNLTNASSVSQQQLSTLDDDALSISSQARLTTDPIQADSISITPETEIRSLRGTVGSESGQSSSIQETRILDDHQQTQQPPTAAATSSREANRSNPSSGLSSLLDLSRRRRRRRASYDNLNQADTESTVTISTGVDSDRRIQRQIELESKKPKRVRVLILGSGRSGKSTLIRKIKLLEGDYMNEQANEFKTRILKFVLNNAKYLIKNTSQTEMKDNMKRRNQLLQMWRFNQQPLSTEPVNSESIGTLSNNLLTMNIGSNSPRKMDRISTSLDDGSSSTAMQRMKKHHDKTHTDEASRITTNFLNLEAVELFKSLWSDKCVKHNFEKLSQNNSTLYNARYFFNKIDVISKNNYIPCSRDILTTYMPSSSIETCQLNFTFPCEFVDITGQRNERRKWIHSHFDKDSLSAVVFLVSLAEYCEYSFSLFPVHQKSDSNFIDSPTGKDPLKFVPSPQQGENCIMSSNMHNSLSLFKEIISYYNDIPVILLFTKLDIFRKRIKTIPLQACFSDFDYTGDHTFLYTNFIADKFINVDPTLKHRCLYTHFVDLIREEVSQMVMDDIKDIILQKTLRDHGLF